MEIIIVIFVFNIKFCIFYLKVVYKLTYISHLFMEQLLLNITKGLEENNRH